MIEVEDALRKILEHTSRLPTETVPLSEALHSVIAETIIVRDDSPPFDSSAMDGYGVKVKDVESASNEKPVALKVAGVVRAGQVYGKALEYGTALKIFTGAMVPEGVEAVLMRERSSETNGEVLIKSSVSAGENIRRRGEELRSGDAALSPGPLITPPVIGFLAGLGYAEVCVYRKPKVAVIVTGDELIEPQEPLQKGKIRDANTYAIQAVLQEIGVDIAARKRVPDDPKKLLEVVDECLQSADVLIVSGGVSVGDFDFVKEVFGNAGIEEVFWKVAVKPGKPIFFGTSGEKLIFGLPGNPASALVTFYLFVRPALLSMMGREKIHPMNLPALMRSEIKKKIGRTEFLRARLQNQNGEVYAELHNGQHSHMLSSFANADCLVVFPKEQTFVAKDGNVKIQLLPWAAL
jgi:molybdopterin molybdotransferase